MVIEMYSRPAYLRHERLNTLIGLFIHKKIILIAGIAKYGSFYFVEI
jgi:hypothetical protein